MVESIFLGFRGIALFADAVYECSDTVDFLLCLAAAVVIQDLVSVRVLSVYSCVWIDPCSVQDSLISKNAISPSVMLLMVSKTFSRLCVFIMDNVSST